MTTGNLARSIACQLDAWTRERLPLLNGAILESNDSFVTVDGLIAEGSAFAARLYSVVNTEGLHLAEGYQIIGDLGMFVASCQRHGVSCKDWRLQPTMHLLRQLGTTFHHPPRDSFYTYIVFNKPDKRGRYKAFSHLRDEQEFIRLTREALGHYERLRDHLRAITLADLASAQVEIGNAVGAVQEYKRTLISFFNDKRNGPRVRPDIFWNCLRDYFSSFQEVGDTLGPASAAYSSVFMEVDLIVGFSDEAQRTHTVKRTDYLLPKDRADVERALAVTPLLDQLSNALEESVRNNQVDYLREVVDTARCFIDLCGEIGKAASSHSSLINLYIKDPLRKEMLGAVRCPFHSSGHIKAEPAFHAVDPMQGSSGMSFDEIEHLRMLRKNNPKVRLLRERLLEFGDERLPFQVRQAVGSD